MVIDCDSVYIYDDESLQELKRLEFPLFSAEFLLVNNSYLLCNPENNLLAVFEFNSATLDFELVCEWLIPDDLKISVACWSLDNIAHILLGTRDGTIVQIDLTQPGQFQIIDEQQSATVSSICPAPCGDGYYAIGHASGLVRICRYVDGFLKNVYSLEIMKKVEKLSFHYSCKDKTNQSLALFHLGNDRLQVYNINMIGNVPPRKIRDIPLPESQTSAGYRFLRWSKSGKIVRVSSFGLVVSDVRTKKVVSRSIPFNDIRALEVRSSKGKGWVIHDKKITLVNLLDGSVLNSVDLPLSMQEEDEEMATILDSPVVYFFKPNQVNSVVYKNKRVMQITPPPSPHCFPDYEPNSLFPTVIENLSQVQSHTPVPEFYPSQLSKEQYLTSAIFGGSVSRSVSLAGMNDILRSLDSENFIFSLYLSNVSMNQLLTNVMSLSNDAKYNQRFVFALLSISSLQRTSGACSADIVNTIGSFVDCENIHHVCAYLFSLDYYKEACKIYELSHYFLESVMIALLKEQDAVPILKNWTSHLRMSNYTRNSSLIHYLDNIGDNISMDDAVSYISMSSSNIPFSPEPSIEFVIPERTRST